jgi:hypothetical protein
MTDSGIVFVKNRHVGQIRHGGRMVQGRVFQPYIFIKNPSPRLTGGFSLTVSRKTRKFLIKLYGVLDIEKNGFL